MKNSLVIKHTTYILLCLSLEFSYGSAGKESACNAGDLGSIPGPLIAAASDYVTFTIHQALFRVLYSLSKRLRS